MFPTVGLHVVGSVSDRGRGGADADLRRRNSSRSGSAIQRRSRWPVPADVAPRYGGRQGPRIRTAESTKFQRLRIRLRLRLGKSTPTPTPTPIHIRIFFHMSNGKVLKQ